MTGYGRLPKGHVIAGRFVIERAIGRGRTSAVYRALDTTTRTHVALKVLDPFLAQDATSVARFAREVAIIRALDHPNVVKLYDWLRDGDLYVICMELVDGVDAKAHLERSGRMLLPEFLPVAKGVVAALEACHRAGVLHRDLKPQNILVTSAGVKLVDFGVSRVNTMSDLTKTGTILGTAEYMAPEQFLSARADPRSDVYALGAVCYELLTGRPPRLRAGVGGGAIEPVATRRPDVPRWLDALVMKCLEADPGRRYQGCYELRRDLERAERGRAVREAAQPSAPCLHCREATLPGLPFCHHCGTFSDQLYDRGPDSLVVYRCEDAAGLRDHICRMAPVASRRAVERGLANPPVVVCRGVSRQTAVALLDECARFPGEMRVVQSLARELKLPRLYFGLAILMTVPLFASGTIVGRLGLTLAGELVLTVLYLRRIRPLVPLAEVRRRRAAADGTLIRIAAGLRDLGDPGLQTIVGNVVAAMLRVRALAGTTGVVRADDLVRLAFVALDAARTLARHTVYLAATSQNEINAHLEAAGRRLDEAQEPGEAARLVAMRAELRHELASYETIQDVHTRTHLALLNLGSVLARLEEALRGEVAMDGVAAELGRLEAGLRAPEASPDEALAS